MRRWAKILIALVVGLWLVPACFALFCMIFLPRHDYWVTMKFPRGFRGFALVVFDQPSGKPLRWEGETLYLDFPRSGLLEVREKMDVYPNSWQPAFAWDDGTPMPVPMNEGTDEIDPRTENVVSVHGGNFIDNKVMIVFVGTDREFRHPKGREDAYRRADRFLPTDFGNP